MVLIRPHINQAKLGETFGVRPIIGEIWQSIGNPYDERWFRYYQHVESKRTVVITACKVTGGYTCEMLNSVTNALISD